MDLINAEDLKAKLDRGEDFKLLMVLSEWAFRAKHIPGSISVTRPEDIEGMLSPDDEIVVYCSDPICPASKYAYTLLKSGGYDNVRRFEGGITGWEDAGYALEGEWAEQEAPAG